MVVSGGGGGGGYGDDGDGSGDDDGGDDGGDGGSGRKGNRGCSLTLYHSSMPSTYELMECVCASMHRSAEKLRREGGGGGYKCEEIDKK